MDKISKSPMNILWIIGGALLLCVPITLFNSSFDANTNGFILYPYAVCMVGLISGDFVAEKVFKKGVVFLIVDGETKESIHLWIKKYLRKQCLYELISTILALLIFHCVIRPLRGYVSSVYDIPWLGILMCVLFMIWTNYIIYKISEAFILKQVRINKVKTNFFYLGAFYAFFGDFNIVNLDQLIFTYIMIGLIVMFATKNKRIKEINRFYEEDLV